MPLVNAWLQGIVPGFGFLLLTHAALYFWVKSSPSILYNRESLVPSTPVRWRRFIIEAAFYSAIGAIVWPATAILFLVFGAAYTLTCLRLLSEGIRSIGATLIRGK